MKTADRPSLPGPRRFWALALICLCLAGQYLGLAHLVTVRHVVCAEHGELVDPPSDDSRLRSPPVLDDDQGGRRLSASSAGPHDHDHCLVLAQRRGHSLPRLSACAPATVPALQVQRPPPATPTALPTIALLLLAPKNSPPV